MSQILTSLNKQAIEVVDTPFLARFQHEPDGGVRLEMSQSHTEKPWGIEIDRQSMQAICEWYNKQKGQI